MFAGCLYIGSVICMLRRLNSMYPMGRHAPSKEEDNNYLKTPPPSFLPALPNRTSSSSWYEDLQGRQEAPPVSSTSSPVAAPTTSTVDSPAQSESSSFHNHNHHLQARAAADSLLTESYFRSAVSNPYFSQHIQGYPHQTNGTHQGKHFDISKICH